MTRWDVSEIAGYLVLAFGGEAVIIHFTPPGAANLFTEYLPHAVFFAGLYLAFRVARRAHRRERDRVAGFFCSQCGYDLRATPRICPECGGENTGKRQVSTSRGTAWGEAANVFLGMLIVAVLAAAAIMFHVQIFTSPPGGH